MLETDFPDGKNPEFCAKLFREEPGVWKLKMEQFKRWLEKGKNDPLPEYYGTGKNCSVCGVFLFDTKSYLKHMKRNHGYKIKDKDKLMLKSEKQKGKEDKSQDDDEHQPETKPPVRTVPTKAQMKAQDPFDMIMTGSLPSTSRLPPPQTAAPSSSASRKDYDIDSDLDDSPISIDRMTKVETKEEEKRAEAVLLPTLSRRKATQNKKYSEEDEDEVKKKSELTSSSLRKASQKKKYVDEDDEKEKLKTEPLSAASKKTAKAKKYAEDEEDYGKEEISSTPVPSSSRRRAISQPEFKDEMVTCPECDFQCLHSKIVQHLKRCTKKMAQTKKSTTAKPDKPHQTAKTPVATQSEPKSAAPEIKKPKQSDIVKKAFLKKFEAQQKMDYFSDSDAETNMSRKEAHESESELDKEDKHPSLKLKFSRKDSGSDLSHFEVSNENISKEVDDKESSKDDEPGAETSLSAILRNINADRSEPKPPKPPLLKSSVIPQISPPKIGTKPDKQEDSSDDEVIPQKSFRLHSFIESLRAMHARLPQRKEDPPAPPPASEQSDSPPKPVNSVESTNLKNKWLQSLEDRSKVKPPEPSPAVNKIQSEIAQMKNKESLIYNKAKLKAYPETPVKASSLKESVSPPIQAEEKLTPPSEPSKRKKKAATFDDDEVPVKAKRKNENQTDVKKDLDEHQREEYHDARPSLRKGNKMIPCPICGAEYAIADNLQKHIDKDHFGETDRVFLKRVKPKSESKEKEKSEPTRKKKKGSSSLTAFDDEEEDEFLGDSRPSLDTSTAEEKFDSLMASSSSKKEKKVEIKEDQDEEEESTKLTEYEIFQKLQLKESSKTEKKRVECSECGKMLPVNTIKRHLLKHEKDALMKEEPEEAPVKAKPPPKPRARKKTNSGARSKKQEQKHLKDEAEKKSEAVKSHDEDDERIPCPLNLKKMIMKRHLMKPEADVDVTVKQEVKVEDKDETDGGKPVAVPASKGRKKKSSSTPNVAKRQIEKQNKIKKKTIDDPEMYAPIEITPTKEYWEYEKEKREKSFDFPSADEDDLGPAKNPRKGSDPEIRNKSLQDLKDAEKSRNTSEEESESENCLEAAVRKVVSYRMTPKQALSHYNLTPKVNTIFIAPSHQ